MAKTPIRFKNTLGTTDEFPAKVVVISIAPRDNVHSRSD